MSQRRSFDSLSGEMFCYGIGLDGRHYAHLGQHLLEMQDRIETLEDVVEKLKARLGITDEDLEDEE
jgi:hypothetical protein